MNNSPADIPVVTSAPPPLQPHLQIVQMMNGIVIAQVLYAIAELGIADFETVPRGGDAYLLAHIIHDWDESSCLKVLGNIRRVLQTGGRLLLVEMVVPDGDDFHLGKLTDMIMLAVGSKERTVAEYTELLAKAGFKLMRVIPTQLPVSVIDALPM